MRERRPPRTVTVRDVRSAFLRASAGGRGFGRRSLPAGLDTAVRALADGADVHGVTLDVADADAAEAVARSAEEAFGAIDLVCLNAGVPGPTNIPLWEIDQCDWQWVLGVNLWGVVNGLRAFIPRLLRRDDAHVVITASVAGLVTGTGEAPYVASKHAVVALAEILQRQLAGSPVGVTVLCPWWVRTDILSTTRQYRGELSWPPRVPANLACGGGRLAFTRRAAPGLWHLGQPRDADGGAALLAPAEAPGGQPGQRGLDLGEREPFGDRAVQGRARPLPRRPACVLAAARVRGGLPGVVVGQGELGDQLQPFLPPDPEQGTPPGQRRRVQVPCLVCRAAPRRRTRREDR
jgi:NAD(P)-dependent dehydrogenase (short-subunit alcohol dehydrogenase family)